MPKFIDSENIITTIGNEPDKLRAEVGKYLDAETSISPSSNNYIRMDLVESTQIDASVFSKRNYTGVVAAAGEFFRDMGQWHDYIQRTVVTDINFLDHTFEYDVRSAVVENDFINQYHLKNYEDATKQFDTRLLANYNLLSYTERNNVSNIRQISQMVTTFDDSLYNINTKPELMEYFNKFSNRSQNYVGSLQSVVNKQKNIFFIDNSSDLFSKQDFPFYYQCNVSAVPSADQDLLVLLERSSKEKNIYQALKNNVLNTARRFYDTRDGLNKVVKITNLISLLTTRNVATFSEGDDELFLFDGSKIPPSDNSNFFADQLNTVKCIGFVRSLISSKQRGFEEIIGLNAPLKNCNVYDMGFKIEKYLGTTQGTPIQTFYFKNLEEFVDTQFSYNIRYTYKIKKLVAVLGASYKYTNLFFADLDEDGNVFYRNEDGDTLQNQLPLPSNLGTLSPTKYKLSLT